MPTLRTVPLAAAALLSACAAKGGDPFQTIGVDEVERMLGRPGVFVLDANERDVYVEHHLPGARLVSRDTLARVLPADHGATLVFYCAGPK